MPLWADDFDRADGPIGNDWSQKSGSLAIVSNGVDSAASAQYVAGPVSGPGTAMAEATIDWTNAPTNTLWPAVKMDANGVGGYLLKVTASGGNITYQLNRNSTGVSLVQIGTFTEAGTLGTSGVVRVTYSAGTVTGYYDGVQKVQATNTSSSANSGIGLFAQTGTGRILAFDASGDGSPRMIVTPTIVGTEDGDVGISLLAVGVAWTPGNPGSPTFTCNAGALSGQVVQTTTDAVAVFSPPLTAQTVTITDPTNGLTDDIVVVEGTYQGGGAGGAGGLPEDVVTWLQTQAAHAGLILTDEDTTTGDVAGIELKGAFGSLLLGVRTGDTPTAPNQAIGAAIMTIWDILNGQLEHTSETDVFSQVIDTKLDTTALLQKWLTANPPTEYTVLDVLGLLGGSPVANHQDILTAIAGIVVDNSEVLDAIAAAQGDPLATIKAVLDSLFVLGGSENNYNLATVKTWVEAARGTDLPTIRDVLNKLGTSGNTIEARIDALSDLIVTETTLQGMLDILLLAVTGGAGITIATATNDIIDAINGIPTATGGGGPRWPGLSGVTLGTEVALADDLVITGPMHGLLFTITGQPVHTQKYMFGSVASWARVGAVIFQTDRGDYERSQTFSLDAQVMVPQTMDVAASATIRLNPDWTGTVRPWTIN